MRKLVIWILIVLIAVGFIYVGNNLIVFKKIDSFPVEYLPESDAVIKSQTDDALINKLFPSLSDYAVRTVGRGSGSIYLYSAPSAVTVIGRNGDSNVSSLDSLLYKFHENGLSTKLYWENGFPVIDVTSLNKEFFASIWRKWIFTSSDKESLQKVFSAIMQKGTLLKNDPNFSLLWKPQKDDDLCGIISKNSKNIFLEKLTVPFLNFKYPLFFTYNNPQKEFNIVNLDSSPEGSLFFKPFDFEGSALEIAEPEASTIKEFIMDSGLQMIISEKIGIPFGDYSLFSSMDSGEFVLFNRNDFLFTVKSTPINSNIYRSEIIRFIPQVKTVEDKINNFLMVTYIAPNLRFFTLETPSMFIISNRKDVLEEIADKKANTLDISNSYEFISVSNQFNEIVNLYNLNVNSLILPDFATNCAVTRTKIGDKIVTKITLK